MIMIFMILDNDDHHSNDQCNWQVSSIVGIYNYDDNRDNDDNDHSNNDTDISVIGRSVQLSDLRQEFPDANLPHPALRQPSLQE